MRASPDLPSSATVSPSGPISSARSRQGLDRRLACVERELRVQFTRIAQLQAELDHVLSMFVRMSKRAPKPYVMQRVFRAASARPRNATSDPSN